MYAIVKTGGKQYRVSAGDKLNVEKLDANVGDKVELETLLVVDGDTVIADPEKAKAVKVVAVVLEQFKGDKVIVLKFKKRKNYKRKNGHRQLLTRIQIESVGSEKAKIEKPAKKEESKPEAEEAVAEVAEAVEAVAAEAEETVAEVQDLAKLTVAQLKEIAAEKGIAIPSGAKKADIVALLSE